MTHSFILLQQDVERSGLDIATKSPYSIPVAVLNPEMLTNPDGSSVGDRMRAFADALVKHGQRGIFVLIDKETGNATITGHIPEDNKELARLLHAAADSMQADPESIKLPQYQ